MPRQVTDPFADPRAAGAAPRPLRGADPDAFPWDRYLAAGLTPDEMSELRDEWEQLDGEERALALRFARESTDAELVAQIADWRENPVVFDDEDEDEAPAADGAPAEPEGGEAEGEPVATQPEPFNVTGSSIPDVLRAVEDGRVSRADALAAEQASAKPRATLIGKLTG